MRPSRRPFLGAAVAAAASGVLLWLASPAVGLGMLAWVAAAPAAAISLGAADPRARRLAMPLAYGVQLELLLVPALPFGLAGGAWGETPVPIMVGDSPVLAVALLGVPAFSALLWLLHFGEPVGAELLPPRLRTAACVLLPAAWWTALDFVRVKLDPGGLFGPLFLTQVETEAGRLAAVGGPWLVTFAVAASGYAIAVASLRLRAAVAPFAGGVGDRHPALGAVVAAAAVGLGIAMLQLAPSATGDAAAIRVAAVQPGYDTAEEDRALLRHFERGTRHLATLDLIDDLAGPTVRAARRGARVVVWPEAVIWAEPRAYPPVRRRLERLARRTGAVLIVPFFLDVPREGAALAVTPAGLRRAQPKQRPMWFLGERGGNRTAPRPVLAGGVRIGTLLGVDNQDPGIARRLAARGADVLVSSTHDWEQLADHQRAMARVHAVATGRPLVRSDWRYGSMIASPDRTELASARPGRRRALVSGAVPAAHDTPYLATGDALAWAVLAVVVLTGGLHARRRRLGDTKV